MIVFTVSTNLSRETSQNLLVLFISKFILLYFKSNTLRACRIYFDLCAGCRVADRRATDPMAKQHCAESVDEKIKSTYKVHRKCITARRDLTHIFTNCTEYARHALYTHAFCLIHPKLHMRIFPIQTSGIAVDDRT